ncbi:MAG: hypothetical protein LBG90_04855 [Spirochaetaceae bacterium]|jgi:hypothetical protein|nr:hypothetical protein [Spirochaetaceae bacterium]
MRIEGIGKPEGCKLIRLQADITDRCLTSIRIRGDFFASPEEGFEQVESQLRNIPLEALAEAFDRRLAQAGVEVFGISGKGLTAVLFSALKAPEPAG